MKKIMSVCAVFFLALAAVFAEFTPANFSLNYKTDSTEKPLAVASSAGLSVSQAYSLSYGGVSGELRYALFADAGLKQGDAQKAVQDFAKKLIPGIAGNFFQEYIFHLYLQILICCAVAVGQHMET